jgi:hypothetical protein
MASGSITFNTSSNGGGAFTMNLEEGWMEEGKNENKIK